MQQQLAFPSIFDSSMLACLKSCEIKFFRTYIQHYKPIGESVHLVAGGAFAKGLEVARRCFYEEKASIEDSIARGLTSLMEAYGHFECPPDSPKSLERTMGALEYYFEQYPLSWNESVPVELASGSRAIEFSFAHPLPISHPETGDPLLYVGRMDALIHHLGGVWICDEKTTTRLGPTWADQWDLRGQFTGYAWGCRQAGIRVDGAVVRGVSILKSKYDTLSPITYRPEWQVDRWYTELLQWIEHAISLWTSGKWKHNLDESCQSYGGCGLKRVCLSEDPQPWLDTYFRKRVWNPLLREELDIELSSSLEMQENGQKNSQPASSMLHSDLDQLERK